MSSRLRRILGYLMMIVALVGVIFTIYLGFRIWRVRPALKEIAVSNISLIKDMVRTTNDLLEIVNGTLSNASSELDVLLKSLLSLSNILQDTEPLIDSIQELTGTTLPGTIDATQVSLTTAQESADIIDNLLRALSRIPFFPGDPYNPDVPLSESLAQISNSLEEIKPSMMNIQTNLDSTKENIGQIDTNLTDISENARQISQNLTDAQETIQQYQRYMTEAETRLDKAEEAAPTWINRIAGGLVIFLTLIAFSQVGLFLQGIQYSLQE